MTESSLSLSVVVMREGPADAVAVERLAERAFGPGRFARTAYRLREAADPDWDLCFVARVSTLLVGSNRMTPVHAGAAPAFMLGPITVDPAFRGRGIAASLMTASRTRRPSAFSLVRPPPGSIRGCVGFRLGATYRLSRRASIELAGSAKR